MRPAQPTPPSTPTPREVVSCFLRQFKTSHENLKSAVAAALPVTVKLPAAGTALNAVSVESRSIGVTSTRLDVLTTLLVMVTDDAPAAMVDLPDMVFAVAAPGVPLVSVAWSASPPPVFRRIRTVSSVQKIQSFPAAA